MKTIELINKTQEYLNYVREHVDNVSKAWLELQEKCKDMRFIYDDYYFFSITDAVDSHDKSKLSEFEFVQYRKAFYPCESEQKFDMTEAWNHHKKENAHHWENWASIASEKHDPSVEVHAVHMILDWMAMGYKFGGTARSYYEKNKEKINIPDWTVRFIYQIFKRIEK
jgi:hypothetical protein